MEDPLSESLLSGEFQGKNKVTVTKVDDEEKLAFEASHDESLVPPAPEPEAESDAASEPEAETPTADAS